MYMYVGDGLSRGVYFQETEPYTGKNMQHWHWY